MDQITSVGILALVAFIHNDVPSQFVVAVAIIWLVLPYVTSLFPAARILVLDKALEKASKLVGDASAQRLLSDQGFVVNTQLSLARQAI